MPGLQFDNSQDVEFDDPGFAVRAFTSVFTVSPVQLGHAVTLSDQMSAKSSQTPLDAVLCFVGFFSIAFREAWEWVSNEIFEQRPADQQMVPKQITKCGLTPLTFSNRSN